MDVKKQKTMKALWLSAHWNPRATYKLAPSEVETRKATNSNAVWSGPKIEFVDVSIPRIEDDEVLIKVKACGVCGSDVHCVEQDQQGYVLFSGTTKLPVIPGHEFSGEIIQTGKKVSTLNIGDAVAAESIMWCGICLACRTGNLNQCQRLEMTGLSTPGAFAEYIAVKEKYCWNLDVLKSVYQSEDKLYETGALIEPIGCAYNGIFVSGGGFKPGAYIAIYGAGPIGLGALLLARSAGAAKIFVFDINESRNQLALDLGADYSASPDTLKQTGSSPNEVIREMTSGYGVDIQIEAAGAALDTMPEITKSFAPNGKMIFLGRHEGTAQIHFDTLVSQANQIMGARGNAGHGVFGNVIRLLATGKVPANQMITSRFAFDRALDAFSQASLRNEGKIMVYFP